MHGQTLECGSTHLEKAAVLVDRLDKSNARGQALGDQLGGDKQLDASATWRSIPHASGHVRGQVARRRIPWSETWPIRRPRLNSIDTEGPPILAVRIPGNQVPAAAGIDEPMWLDGAAAPRPGM